MRRSWAIKLGCLLALSLPFAGCAIGNSVPLVGCITLEGPLTDAIAEARAFAAAHPKATWQRCSGRTWTPARYLASSPPTLSPEGVCIYKQDWFTSPGGPGTAEDQRDRSYRPRHSSTYMALSEGGACPPNSAHAAQVDGDANPREFIELVRLGRRYTDVPLSDVLLDDVSAGGAVRVFSLFFMDDSGEEFLVLVVQSAFGRMQVVRVEKGIV